MSADNSQSQILQDALSFIEGLTASPLLMGDDIEMRLEDVQAHAKIEVASLRKRMNNTATPALSVESEEAVAAALWQEEAREGTPKSIWQARTLEAFRDTADSSQERWRRFARAALAAAPAMSVDIEEALRPFADAVFNDNGDMTVTPVYGREAYVNAYFAHKRLTAPNPSPAEKGGDAEARFDYLSDAQARELFGTEDDELPDGRVRVCAGEWVRIPGGYYFDASAGLLHPETATPSPQPADAVRGALEDAKKAERHRIFRLLWDHSEHVNAYSLGLLVKDDASVIKALPPLAAFAPDPAPITLGNPATEEEWQDRNGLSRDETSDPTTTGISTEDFLRGIARMSSYPVEICQKFEDLANLVKEHDNAAS